MITRSKQASVPETPATLADLIGNAGTLTRCSAGTLLFSEGEAVRGVHILCKGRVKLSMDSPDGKTLVLKIAKPGDFLDLGSAVVARPHEVSAEAAEDCELRFVPQADFLRLIQKDGRACLLVAETLGRDFHDACRSLTLIGLSRTAESRIAELLLRDMQDGKGSKGILKLSSTHEQIAQMIGTSRETVTRVLARLRNARIIEIHGRSLTLRDPEKLYRIGALNEPLAQMHAGTASGFGASQIAQAAS
jgi:CRP/FNR family transcriptional regulator